MKQGSNSQNGAKSKNGRAIPYVLRKSPIQGRGAFATRTIKKGERIGNKEADLRYPIPKEGEHHHTFLFEVDEDTCVDASVKGNSARFINHSCDPNCEPNIEEGRIFIDALRDIRKGEELLYDYHFILDEPHNPANKRLYPCTCGAANCRGTILGKKR